MSPTTRTPADRLRLHHTFETMQRHGGDFCAALAAAWFKADERNKARIEAAFPHLLLAYGPESPYYTFLR